MSVIGERVVDLPTVAALKRRREEREKAYVFRLTAEGLRQVTDIGDAAIVAYALICGASWGDRAGRWVTVPDIALNSLDRGYRWWHAATSHLAAAGLIEVDRQRGRLPRYRLAVTTKKSKKGASK